VSTPSENEEAPDVTDPAQDPAPADSDRADPGMRDDESLDPLQEAEGKLAALKDQLLRTAADFDNFRKRTRREAEEAREAGRESMLKDLLPVFDNLERALAASGAATDVKSFASGIDMVTRQFSETLAKSGIERVKSVGEPFDPAVHEAIQHLETSDQKPGHVVAEVQGGYRSSQRLLRPALVVVAKLPVASAAADTEQEPQAD
jgi:molecular chaperone GrpE